MKISAKLLAVVVLGLALAAPHLAEARAGGGANMGSRGSHTYSAAPSYNASPITRSVTPQPQAQPSMQPQYAPAGGYGYGYSPYGGGFGFWHGLAGGFLGVSIAHMLFGPGYGYYGMGAPMGGAGILPLIIIIGLGWFLFRRIRNNAFGASSFYDASPLTPAAPSSALPWGAQQVSETPLALNDGDYKSFQDLLEKIQMAWGNADLQHLRQYVTPEMLQYFSEELSANTSRGEINRIADVSFIDGNLSEAWSEADLEYATVQMRWKAVDYMARADRQPGDADYVASGNATQPVEAQELWTFARAHGGGRWLLSAIQQIR